MSNGILVFVEHRSGVLNRTSLEALAAAQMVASQLQQTVNAVVLGSEVNALAREIAAYEVAKVIQAQNAKLADYTPDGYAVLVNRLSVTAYAPRLQLEPRPLHAEFFWESSTLMSYQTRQRQSSRLFSRAPIGQTRQRREAVLRLRHWRSRSGTFA